MIRFALSVVWRVFVSTNDDMSGATLEREVEERLKTYALGTAHRIFLFR